MSVCIYIYIYIYVIYIYIYLYTITARETEGDTKNRGLQRVSGVGADPRIMLRSASPSAAAPNVGGSSACPAEVEG